MTSEANAVTILLAILSVPFIYIEGFIHVTIEYDFQFWKQNVNQGMGIAFKVIRMGVSIFLTILFKFSRENTEDSSSKGLRILISTIGLFTSVYLGYDDVRLKHFGTLQDIKRIYTGIYVLTAWEFLLNLIQAASDSALEE